MSDQRLYLIRAPVRLDALARWAAERGLGWAERARAAHYDEGAALHHLIGESLGAGALQPFRLLTPPRKSVANLYGYAEEPAATLRERLAMAALPEAAAVLDANGLEHKPMPAEWREAQRLGFDVRLRPVVRLARAIAPPGDRSGRRAHGFREGSEVDAFLAEALNAHPQDREGMETAERRREDVYLDWLAERLKGAAAIETGRLVRFRRSVAARNGAAREGPDVVVQGTLLVAEPELFADRLRRGVGRHRAYGYGMLLLRPPGAPVPRA